MRASDTDFFGIQEDVTPIEPPLPFEKQSNMDDWRIPGKIEDVLTARAVPPKR